MAGAEQDLLRCMQFVNTAINAANLIPKSMDELSKMLDILTKNLSNTSFDRKAAELLKAKLGDGENLKCLVIDNNKKDLMIKTLIRQGVPFVETTMNSRPAILYASSDYQRIQNLFIDELSKSKEIPIDQIIVNQCNIQKSSPEKLVMLKEILDENDVSYTIKDNDLIYPAKYEDKVKIANEIVAIQRQFPEVLDYEQKKTTNCLNNFNKFNKLATDETLKNSKDIGFFDKSGMGIIFSGMSVYVISKENERVVNTIFNRNEFINSEEYALFLEKLSKEPNIMQIKMNGLSERVKEEGITGKILENIKDEHKKEALKIYDLTKEQEEKLKEISKMTQIFIIDEHPGGYKEMKLARCVFSSQAILSSYREPDPDGPMDNKIPEEIKTNIKEEIQSIDSYRLSNDEIERLIFEERIFEDIEKINSLDISKELEKEETLLEN